MYEERKKKLSAFGNSPDFLFMCARIYMRQHMMGQQPFDGYWLSWQLQFWSRPLQRCSKKSRMCAVRCLFHVWEREKESAKVSIAYFVGSRMIASRCVPAGSENNNVEGNKQTLTLTQIARIHTHTHAGPTCTLIEWWSNEDTVRLRNGDIYETKHIQTKRI